MKVTRCKIDVTKIDKAHLFKGEKGTYLDCTILWRDEDQYGNHGMIVQDVSKAEHEQGVKGAILGNVKNFGDNTKKPKVDEPVDKTPQPNEPFDNSDSLPF